MRLVESALSSLWAMEAEPLERLIEIASREHNVSPKALEAYRSETLKRAERATVREGVAILNVEGPLFKRANLMTEFCGASSYDVLRRDLQVAIDNPAVHSILLNVDSPGGEAAGTGELASAIRSFRGTKPIVAYAGDLAASAAYWIASAADRIVIGAGAGLGSIGVRATYSDASARDEKTGVRRYEFVSSQSPYKATDLKTDDGRARVQTRVDALAQVFVETVADNRGASVEHVLAAFGRGDVLIGQAAINAGMADEIGTFEETLAALAAGQTDPLTGRQNAASAAITQEELTITEAEIQARIDAAIAKQARAAQVATVMSSVRVERERAKEIVRMTPAGLGHVSSAAIQAGMSAEAYQHEIAAQAILASYRLVSGE